MPSRKNAAKPMICKVTFVPVGKSPAGQNPDAPHVSQIGARTTALLVSESPFGVLYCPTEPQVSVGGFPTRSFTPCRSEEHTSELQSRLHLVCRLLLEKKKKRT